MPFPILDACFYLFAGEKLLPEEVAGRARRDVPGVSSRHDSTGYVREVRAALPAVDLQVGAVAALAAHRQSRPRTRARTAVAGRDEVDLDATAVKAEERQRRPIPLSNSDYKAIAAFRAVLRRFLHFSEEAAREAGISPQQHQLLLAIRGFSGEADAPTIGDLAEALQIRHHSCRGAGRSAGVRRARQSLDHGTGRAQSLRPPHAARRRDAGGLDQCASSRAPRTQRACSTPFKHLED